MDNSEANLRIEGTKTGAYIDKLVWIAVSMDSVYFDDFMNEIRIENWKSMFPEIYTSGNMEGYIDDGEAGQMLLEYEKFGFLARVLIPKSYNFKYEDPEHPTYPPKSWSVNGGICSVEYVYAETREELIKEVEDIAESVFRKEADRDEKQNMFLWS